MRPIPHFPTDYDRYAPTYAWARSAVPWVLEPLGRLTDALPPRAAVLEIGCGTGNYIHALADRRPDLICLGFDRSKPMLREARRRPSRIGFVCGDAATAFPAGDLSCGLAFAVDVIHHIDGLARFFAEGARVLTPAGHLVLVTDSEATMRRRSLTKYFPEILPIELARYPSPTELHQHAAAAGLRLVEEAEAVGDVPLTDEFLARMDAKCSSAMRLMALEDHAAGMDRLRVAQSRGDQWRSCYTVLQYGLTPP